MLDQIYDYINSELTHNKTYAYRLPPTFIEQARYWANYHEHGVFSDKDIHGIGNIAGRTLLHTIITSLERIAFNGDPLQFMLVETTYQPFISLFQQTGILDEHPELKGFPNYASALAIELRRGSPPDVRDFVRFRFKNGTSNFQDVHVFGHHADIPVTEFIYRAENAAITSNRQWKEACGLGSGPYDILGRVSESATGFTGAYIFTGLLGLFFLHKLVKRVRARRESRLRLEGDEAPHPRRG